MGDHRQSPGRDLRDGGRHRRSGERLARQSGHLQGEGLHGQRLQHRRFTAIDCATLHADAARAFVVGRRRTESVPRGLSGRPRRDERDKRQDLRWIDCIWRRRALYKGKTRVGGLGISGDTACADHEIAKRIRHLAQLDPEKGEFADDIVFTSADGASPFAHPLCANTWRNGQKLGDEANAAGY